DPLFAGAPMLLGQIRFAEKHYSEAVDLYTKALSLSVEPDQQAELRKLIGDASKSAAAASVEAAKNEVSRNRLTAAWTGYACGLKVAPGDSALLEAMLLFERDHPDNANLSVLPDSAVATALRTPFWSNERQAESAWKAGRGAESLQSMLAAVRNMTV